MRRAAIIALGSLAALLIAVIVVYAVFTGPGEIPPATVDFARLGDQERRDLVARGRYVSQTADCVACHKSEDGLSFAGGLPMETPFGTIYGTNVTPSPTHGIGGWSADDLYRALVWGINPDGSRLYPAMPYMSYHYMTRADVDALWVFLMDQPAVDKPDRAHDLAFPFNIRPALAFWNLLFRPDDRTLPDISGKSESWHRGRYLVDVLGHCGECHTPRNIAYAKKSDQHLKGEIIENAESPDITAAGLVARGWTPRDLASFLKIGLAPQGTMTFRMFPVLNHSTKYLIDDDLAAMVTYLLDGADERGAAGRNVAPRDGGAPAAATASAETTGASTRSGQRASETADHAGRRLYMGLCAGCHGPDGEGRPHASVPMATNTTAMLENPLNLVRIVREGVPEHSLANRERMQAMPAFADVLSHEETAQLVNYLRLRWGGRPGDVTAQRVAELVDRYGQRRPDE